MVENNVSNVSLELTNAELVFVKIVGGRARAAFLVVEAFLERVNARRGRAAQRST